MPSAKMSGTPTLGATNHTLTLLTIVAETLLKDRLIHEVRQAGAKGFTITEVSGEGSRQRRVSDVSAKSWVTTLSSKSSQSVKQQRAFWQFFNEIFSRALRSLLTPAKSMLYVKTNICK